MIENVRRIMGDMITVHHSYDPDIVFDSPTQAPRHLGDERCAVVSKQSTAPRRRGSVVCGYYYETYEKREGRWLFTSRRWHRYFGSSSDGVNFPKDAPKGSNAFDGRNFDGAPS